MAVTNLVKDQSGDHAKRLALFAIEVTEAAGQVPIDPDVPSMGFVTIRVGMLLFLCALLVIFVAESMIMSHHHCLF